MVFPSSKHRRNANRSHSPSLYTVSFCCAFDYSVTSSRSKGIVFEEKATPLNWVRLSEAMGLSKAPRSRAKPPTWRLRWFYSRGAIMICVPLGKSRIWRAISPRNRIPSAASTAKRLSNVKLPPRMNNVLGLSRQFAGRALCFWIHC